MRVDWFRGNLILLRSQKGYSRAELAAKAGLRSEAGVRDLEQGRRYPSWPTVLALCEALGVTPDAFAGDPGEVPRCRSGARPRAIR